MKFFFPDSQDLVDPSFDFLQERRAVDRIRQRDDVYAHEVFSSRPFDGLLVSKGIVDGVGTGGRYSMAQRHRLLRSGAHEFFRIESAFPIIGDCGAFTYVREKEPPYTVAEVVEFYSSCGFDLGIAVDHVILAYQPAWDENEAAGGQDLVDARERQAITLELAKEFIRRSSGQHFEPMGVAQGWSPRSYAHAVKALQALGYTYIALGGMVPLKTNEILACLAEIDTVRRPQTRLHLLGVTRIEKVAQFGRYGVVSFDSTSPLRQAFKDDKDNYYTLDRTYVALRVPQVEGNPRLQKRIKAGQVSQPLARKLERACLETLRAFDEDHCSIEDAAGALRAYEELHDPGRDHTAAYLDTLSARPWKRCACDICQTLGHHVAMFRGAERNRRRGFHNIWVFYRRLRRELGLPTDPSELPSSLGPGTRPERVAKEIA